jgi:hypothetical protein
MNKLSIFIEKDDIEGDKKWIIYDGLVNNPNVKITKDIDTCDYIFLTFRDFSKVNKKEFYKKLIIIDYRDDPKQILNVPCFKYFKRSVINKKYMKFVNYNREIIPISYCLKQDVLNFTNIFDYNRDIDICVFFQPGKKSYRSRLASFIKNHFKEYNIFVGICGNDGKVGRTTIQMDYYKKMFHSKIVITCNPDNWEGDYRTWEALSTGTLVFVDKMKTPIVNPLINKKHVVFYDRNDFFKLKNDILFYLNNLDLAKNISNEGYLYALKYHKPSDRINEILSHL